MTSATFGFPAVLGRPKPPPPPEVAPPPAFPRIRRSLATAYRIDAEIRDGICPDQAGAARKLGMTRARVTQLSNLLFLSPAIQEAILTDPASELRDLSERRLRHIAAVPDWGEQIVLWDRLRA